MTFSLHCNALLPDFSQPRFRDALAGIGLFQPYRCRGRLFPNGRGRGRAGGSHDFLIALMVNELSAHRHLGYSSSNLISGSGLNTLVKMKELQLGVFQKSKSGFQTVARPSEMFLSEQHSDSDVLARRAVAVVLDGSRAFVIEIQGCTEKRVDMQP
nr:Endopeptidase La [Ipomoea batatas]